MVFVKYIGEHSQIPVVGYNHLLLAMREFGL